MNSTISSKVATYLDLFKNLQSSTCLEWHETEVPVFAWQDELGRLRVWVTTTDALQEDQYSLEYRLRDASHIKRQVIRQLDRLQRVLEDLQLVLEEPLPGEASGSETEDEKPTNEARSMYRSLVDSIDSLYQRSILIRKPAPCDKFVGMKKKDAMPSESYDQQRAPTEGQDLLDDTDTIGAEQNASKSSEKHDYRDLPVHYQESSSKTRNLIQWGKNYMYFCVSIIRISLNRDTLLTRIQVPMSRWSESPASMCDV